MRCAKEESRTLLLGHGCIGKRTAENCAAQNSCQNYCLYFIDTRELY